MAISTLAFAAYFKFENKFFAALISASAAFAGYTLGNFFSSAVLTVFALAGLLVTTKAMEFPDFRQFIAVAALGMLSHPFGDVFTGTPPKFFYPLDITLFPERVLIFQNPVFNLLSIFTLEFSLVIAGFVTYANLNQLEFYDKIHPFSFVGIFYAPAALLIPPPTLDVAYQFVFSILGFGLIVALSAFYLLDDEEANLIRYKVVDTGFNLVAAVSMALIGYVLVFVIF